MRAYAHNYAEARKQAGDKLPVLGFRDGAKHVLLPTGQHVRTDHKDRSVSGKTLRRQRIAARRVASGQAQPKVVS